eukprot:m.453662 g.453662  ORF g.453662 m.453662 type:complete len:256 (-) comp21553_c0_seq3:403-1170(-)
MWEQIVIFPKTGSCSQWDHLVSTWSAFVAQELPIPKQYSRKILIVGIVVTDGNVWWDGNTDLSTKLSVLPVTAVGYTSFGKACPTTRYDPQGNYYYVFGGGDIITLTRSKDLKLWEHATDMLATGCISDAVCSQYRPQCAANATSFNKCCVERPDCSLPQNGGRIAHGYFINYWANRSDCNSQGCVRDCVRNESTWNWSVNDADFTDEGGKGEHRLHRFVKCCCGCARSGDMQDISDDIDSSGGIGCDTLSCCSG